MAPAINPEINFPPAIALTYIRAKISNQNSSPYQPKKNPN